MSELSRESYLSVGGELWRADAEEGVGAIISVERTDADEIKIEAEPTDGEQSVSIYLSKAAAAAIVGVLNQARMQGWPDG